VGIKRRVAVIAIATLGLTGIAGPAFAGTSGRIALKPVVVNPCGGAVESGAVAQWEQGTGMNSNNDPEYFGLHLRPGGSCTIASATFTNVKGVVLSKLGFSVRDDTPCSGGNPRWHITTRSRDFYEIACAAGVAEPDSGQTLPGVPPFTKYTFNDASVTPFCHLNRDMTDCTGDAAPWPGFGRAEMRTLDIIVDTASPEGFYLDDIRVNRSIFSKP
jgi:hypothetical protein